MLGAQLWCLQIPSLQKGHFRSCSLKQQAQHLICLAAAAAIQGDLGRDAMKISESGMTENIEMRHKAIRKVAHLHRQELRGQVLLMESLESKILGNTRLNPPVS